MDREKIINAARQAAEKAIEKFPYIEEIYLIGSIATGEQTGTSDVDILVVASVKPDEMLDHLKELMKFFVERIDHPTDVIINKTSTKFSQKILLAKR
ncbi:MAG: nucleotidyltransferase domain-containing protein [Thermotogae bacterium]|nr:nucleotidyltransferase domain-containing protein [Thermotogota bacterium]